MDAHQSGKIIEYRCSIHNVTMASKMGIQLHLNAERTVCDIEVIREAVPLNPKDWLHHMGNGQHSPCGLVPADVYRGLQASFTSAWEVVTCPICLSRKPEPRRTEKPITLTEYNDAGPKHTPPNMNDHEDGVFTFFDVHLGQRYTMEVVPQLSGNVEITVGTPGDGTMFSLSHLDRADLLRALLHNFHYSPEVGGPSAD